MNVHLILFFTRGVSLRTWSLLGILDRETALYRRFMEAGMHVGLVTYGDSSDLDYANRISGIDILCNERGMPLDDYEQSISSLHQRELSACDLIKTNQTNGAAAALTAACLYEKPLLARCGYMWSTTAARRFGAESTEALEAARVEKLVFESADRVIVTTPEMRSHIETSIPDAASKTVIIPNYVDVDLFRPTSSHGDPNAITFVGRISPEKNLESLLEAIHPLPVSLSIFGEGVLRPELQERFASLDGRVGWLGNVPNSELPQWLSRSGLFVIPSFYEGHPKALLEAMACGCTVIGADSPGIRELIDHKVTGYLCGTDSVSIREAIEELRSNRTLCRHLSKNAREFVRMNYSLDKIAARELDLLREVKCE
jgi:glycosyltransferase involved in cell wall biosynthesis